MLLAGTNIQVRNPKVFSESSHSDGETDVAWKTSHWSSTLEAALHESDPCFSSLSIPHSSLASTSLLRFKDQDTAFDIQLKFRGSSCLPLDTCAFHCEKLSLICLPVLSPNHPIWLSVHFLSVLWRGPPFLFEFWQLPLCFNPPPTVSSILSSFQHPIFPPICADVTRLSHGGCLGQPENSGFDSMTHWDTVLRKQLYKSLAQT